MVYRWKEDQPLMDIEELMIDCHYLAKEKGFWDTERNVPEMLALVHSEISEALEEYRDGNMERDYGFDENFVVRKPEGFGVELADAVIRILDLAGGLNIPLADLIEEKLAYNRTRPQKHGKVC